MMKRWMPLLSVIVAQVFFGVIAVRVPELSMLWQWSVIGAFAMACAQLHKDFARAGRNAQLPFNTDHMSYSAESYRQVCHENPARIAWVKDQLQQLTE